MVYIIKSVTVLATALKTMFIEILDSQPQYSSSKIPIPLSEWFCRMGVSLGIHTAVVRIHEVIHGKFTGMTDT